MTYREVGNSETILPTDDPNLPLVPKNGVVGNFGVELTGQFDFESKHSS
jgi:hypothetical protein